MILINQSPLNISNIIKKYPKNSIEHKVLITLDKSETQYNFNSLEELQFELNLRKAIVDSSIKLYRSYFGFAVFRKTKCNEKYWKRTNNGGFLLKSNVNSSDAINDIYENSQLYATECATAMVIVYYKALLDVYGKSKFDSIFTKIYLMNWHYIDRRLRDIGYMRPVNDYLPGDRRYFKNPDVDPKTPEWQGENVIDLSEGLYYGHGIGVHDAQTIINTLNETRKRGSRKSAYLMDTVGLPDFKSLFKLM